ncbi:hypothetical protein JR065_01995 [Xanthomonas sp. AmX2]|uniref:hypothetical protein n=1 Tax=Xanthomonas sp. TaxID=29446 RepID=UPI00197CDBFE|nr:hypothetical protein [Xanthomonas sp.]MBN6149098.1 hypothetical protein [Xanthomonas sp.]
MKDALVLSAAALPALVPASPAHAGDCEAGASNMAQLCHVADQADAQLATKFQRTLEHVRAPDAAQPLVAAQQCRRDFAAASCDYTTAARQAPALANGACPACMGAFAAARIDKSWPPIAAGSAKRGERGGGGHVQASGRHVRTLLACAALSWHTGTWLRTGPSDASR